MGAYVFCNLGSKDILLDGGLIRPSRGQGKALLEQYETLHERISLPIIAPALRFILEQQQLLREKSPDYQERGEADTLVERIVLFGTDQSDPRYQSSDTCHFAELAAQRLPELFPDVIDKIEIIFIKNINPALYDETFEAFDDYLGEVSVSKEDICYTILTGGIPACNTALLLQGVRHFGRRLRVVYQPKEGRPRELRVGAQLLNTFDEVIVLDRLERHDFANALPVLEKIHAGSDLIHLCRYAAQRMAFDFRSARLSFSNAMRDGSRDTRRFLRRQEHVLDLSVLLEEQDDQQLHEDRMMALLQELFWNAAVTFNHHRYADFLGRIYRFQEATLRYLVENIYGLSTDLNPKVVEQTQTAWKEEIQSNPNLLSYLQSRQMNGKKLDWTRIGRPTYQTMVTYAIKKQGRDKSGELLVPAKDSGRMKRLLRLLNGLDALVALRHRTIIGHDFQGVSRDDVVRALSLESNERTPVDRLRNILRSMMIAVEPDPYEVVSEFLHTQLLLNHIRR